MAESEGSSGAALAPLVEIRGLRKTYDGRTSVIDDLHLTIRRGEFLTLLGPSGSGKTTTLMMLAGFELPTAGEILYEGRSIERLPPHERNFGVVFQNYALFPHMSVAENVAFPLSVRKMPRLEIESRVEQALATVQLSGFGGRRPTQLSGGQQQRVALARALVFEPQLVLMDEPLGALDKNLREQLQIEIKRLHERLGITIVYVTHDQTEAMVLSDRIAIFNAGRIQQLDAPKAVHEFPATAFVASFMGETNLLVANLVSTEPDSRCEVELRSGSKLFGTAVGSSRAGAPRVVAVRPERITLNPPEGEFDNVLVGSVAETVYLGDGMTLRVVIDDGSEFMVRGGMESVDNPPPRGTTVRIGWNRQHCLVLEAG